MNYNYNLKLNKFNEQEKTILDKHISGSRPKINKLLYILVVYVAQLFIYRIVISVLTKYW